jgi:hypothetical protein
MVGELGEIEEVGVGVEVEVGEAAAGSGVFVRPAEKVGAFSAQALAGKPVIPTVHFTVSIEIAASGLGDLTEAQVVERRGRGGGAFVQDK